MPTPGSIDADYVRWKTLVPFLYDWFAHHRVVWPSLSCRWGAVLERNEFKHKQRLYLSEQTDGSASHPNTLVVCNVDVVKRRVAAAESMIFEEESRSAFVKSWKKIIHPGEVNKMREFESRPELLVTHTDAPELLFWNTDTQPHRKTTAAASSAPAAPAGAKAPALDAQSLAPSKPDLVLVGHEENAEFALAAVRIFKVIPCNVGDPLVIDLDGDGIEMNPIHKGVNFDFYGTGAKQATAWPTSDDGLLVLDRDG